MDQINEQSNDKSSKMLLKYPDRIPIIVKRYKECNLPEIDKNKYLVPKDMKINSFVYVIRRKLILIKNYVQVIKR